MKDKNQPLMFVRSEEGVFLGVCGGLAKAFELEVWMMRLVWLIAGLWFGTGFFMYILLAYTLPRSDKVQQAYRRKILGVCVRISRRYNIEIGIVRTAAVFMALASFGMMLVFYFGAHLLMPAPDEV